MLINNIDKHILNELISHNNSLGIKRKLKSIGYERSAELPFIVKLLKEQFAQKKIQYLDIGSGDSILPTFFLKTTNWDITCIDKYNWVNLQNAYASKICPEEKSRLHVEKKDILNFNCQTDFDVITNISVIEHFKDDTDIEAIKHSSSFLKSNGLYILTTLVNEPYYKKFYKKDKVYGEFKKEGTFYQRHYDLRSLQKRIIEPSGLVEIERIYFGEYGFPFGEHFLFPSLMKNPLKIFYKWLSPYIANHFLSYSDNPISRRNMAMDTAAGVILVLKKAS